ncbi:MAG: CPBP family intramembrane metalloprotease [Bacteroidales bacterium]|nr:CPBP family intramembrane metalloprotease [Bacteroidales bacterium]
MKKFFKVLGVIALLIVVYSLFQGLLTGLAMVVFVVYAIIAGKIDVNAIATYGDAQAFMENPVMEGYVTDAMAWGLFLSAINMLLFIHLTRLFRLRMSIFGSIARRPLVFSTFLVFTSMFALNIFVQWFPLEDMLTDQFEGLTHTLLGAFTISVLAPVLEEVMFRGAIQGYMMRRFRRPWLAIVVAGLVFGIFHMNPVQVVYASLLGIIFGWIYYRTRSLLSVIVGHVLNNTIATITMLFFADTSEAELIGENFSPVTETAMEVMMFLGFAAVSVLLAIKLHRMLPPVQVPWSDACDGE